MMMQVKNKAPYSIAPSLPASIIVPPSSSDFLYYLPSIIQNCIVNMHMTLIFNSLSDQLTTYTYIAVARCKNPHHQDAHGNSGEGKWKNLIILISVWQF